MSRFGTPIGQQGTARVWMVVSVEFPDGRYEAKVWRGSSVKYIHIACRDHYGEKVKLHFNQPLYVNSYGAH